jgi:hypothetical protein
MNAKGVFPRPLFGRIASAVHASSDPASDPTG